MGEKKEQLRLLKENAVPIMFAHRESSASSRDKCQENNKAKSEMVRKILLSFFILPQDAAKSSLAIFS